MAIHPLKLILQRTGWNLLGQKSLRSHPFNGYYMFILEICFMCINICKFVYIYLQQIYIEIYMFQQIYVEKDESTDFT